MYSNVSQSVPGRFSLCSGKWKGGQFHPSYVNDIKQCCLDTCMPQLSDCQKICNEEFSDPKNCLTNCDRIGKTCHHICETTSKIWIENPFQDCGEQTKDNLLRCCMDMCSPLQNIDCTRYCQDRYDAIFPKDKNVPQFTPKVETYSDKSNSWLFFIGVLIVSVVIFGLLQLKNKRGY